MRSSRNWYDFARDSSHLFLDSFSTSFVFFFMMDDLLTVSWDDEVAFCPQGGQRADSPLSSTFIFLTEQHCTDEEVDSGGLCT